MTSDDYRAALARLGLTQTRAAVLLGVDPRTSQRWALGERAISPTVATLLLVIETIGLERYRRIIRQSPPRG